MKLLIFVAVFVPAFVTIRATDEMGNLINGFARIFEINTKDVEKCIHKMGATIGDFQLLGNVISQPEALQVEEANKLDEELGRKSARRAICVASCCANIQGSMIGSQIQVAVLHNTIKKSSAPAEVKLLFSVVVTECNDEVKDITDECDVAFRFVSCLATKLRHFGM